MTDSAPAPVSRLQAVAIWALVITIGLLGITPYQPILHHYPWKVDAVKWVVRGAYSRDRWWEWVFADTHFVGYRPVVAITYTLNSWLDGWGPEVYRATDLGLHVLAILAVAAVFRALIHRTEPWILVPAILFAGHPASQEIIPFLARRSYSLSTVLAATGVALWLRGLHDKRAASPHAVAGAFTIVLALLSNEVAYVVLPVLPLFALSIRQVGLKRALERCIPTYAGASFAILLRFWIMGWAGGYSKHYFAGTRDGLKSLRQVEYWNGHEIVGAAFDFTWFPISMDGSPNPLRADNWLASDLWSALPSTDITQALRLLLFTVVAYYTWAILFEPLFSRPKRKDPTGWILLIWMLGYAVLFGLSRTWFWRQGYPMAVPFTLLISWHLRQTVQSRPFAWPLRLLPQLILVIAMLWHSPVLHGMSSKKMMGRIHANEMLYSLESLLPPNLDRGTIYVILPGKGPTSSTTRRWLGRIYPERKIRWEILATGLPMEDLVRLEGDTLLFSPTARITAKSRKRYAFKENHVKVEALARPRASAWLLYPDPQGEWKLTDLKSP